LNVRGWFALRGPGYVRRRAAILLDRYGIHPSQAMARVEGCVAALARCGCAPTFPTPGRVVQRYPAFLRHLQDAGAEIAVHSYDHVDLGAVPSAEACEQLVRAARVFAHHAIAADGFRCPYLSYTDDLMDALPTGLFGYSSNQAIWWDVVPSASSGNASTLFDTLQGFYKPRLARETVCVPWTRSNMVEIPVCLPDDLQLHDGLHLDREGMAQAWDQILRATHRRGELFTLLFHPELASYCEQPLTRVLRESTRLQPRVWIASLRDVSTWWREKSGFGMATSPTPRGLHISFTCSQRATILAKGLGPCASGNPWDGTYIELEAKTLDVPAEPRPFIGLPADAPKRVVDFLREQGYILDAGETATLCGTYLDATALAGLTSEVELVNTIEASGAPLVRYWRWPGSAKSAMCVTGDLDALTLLDYASRLFVTR
jgi:hypothetical protein